MKTLEDRWYVVINAYQFTVFEIWRDFLVLSYITCPRYPYIRVYRLYDIGGEINVDREFAKICIILLFYIFCRSCLVLMIRRKRKTPLCTTSTDSSNSTLS